MGCLRTVSLILVRKEKFEFNRCFRNSSELENIIDKLLDKPEDNPSIFYTRNVFSYFGNFKRVNESKHGKCANEFESFLEYEG